MSILPIRTTHIAWLTSKQSLWCFGSSTVIRINCLKLQRVSLTIVQFVWAVGVEFMLSKTFALCFFIHCTSSWLIDFLVPCGFSMRSCSSLNPLTLSLSQSLFLFGVFLKLKRSWWEELGRATWMRKVKYILTTLWLQYWIKANNRISRYKVCLNVYYSFKLYDVCCCCCCCYRSFCLCVCVCVYKALIYAEETKTGSFEVLWSVRSHYHSFCSWM